MGFRRRLGPEGANYGRASSNGATGDSNTCTRSIANDANKNAPRAPTPPSNTCTYGATGDSNTCTYGATNDSNTSNYYRAAY